MSTTTDTLTMEQAQALPLSPALLSAVAAGEGMHPIDIAADDREWLRTLGAQPDDAVRGYYLHQQVDATEVAILACRAGDRRTDALTRLAGRLANRSVTLRRALAQREASEAEAAALRLLLTGAEERLAETREELAAVQERLAAVQADRDQHRQQALSSCDSMLEAFNSGQVRESRICELEDTIARLQPLAEAEQQRQDAIAAKRSRAAKAAAAKRRREAAPAKKARLEQRYQDMLGQASTKLAEGRISDAIHGALARRLGVTRSWVPRWAAKAGDAPREEYVSGYHTTPAGTRVHYPSAYGYRTVYHTAVREIHVGRGWLKRNLRSLCREAAAHR